MRHSWQGVVAALYLDSTGWLLRKKSNKMTFYILFLGIFFSGRKKKQANVASRGGQLHLEECFLICRETERTRRNARTQQQQPHNRQQPAWPNLEPTLNLSNHLLCWRSLFRKISKFCWTCFVFPKRARRRNKRTMFLVFWGRRRRGAEIRSLRISRPGDRDCTGVFEIRNKRAE